MRTDYLGLVAFVAVADHGSFQRGAEALNISQSALSHRLRKLEEDLGTPLLIRSSREVSLTTVGQGLLPEARRILKELHDTYESVRGRGQRMRNRLTFACLPTVANACLPAVLAAFGNTHPKTGIELLDVPVVKIAESVRSGIAAFGVTIVSAELSDLRLWPLAEEEYRLLVPRDHEFARKGFVERTDLEGVTMARISTQSKNRQLLDVALGVYRDRMRWQYEVQNATTAMRLVAEGTALTILPASAILMAPANLVSVPFTDVRLSRTLGVVVRRGVPLADAASELLSMIEAQILRLHEAKEPATSTEAAKLPD